MSNQPGGTGLTHDDRHPSAPSEPQPAPAINPESYNMRARNQIQLGLKTRGKVNLLKISHWIRSRCGSADGIAPPDYLQVHYGNGSFFEGGLEFFRHLLDHCNLQRDSSILDVGCGIGRMAMPLTAFLGPMGRYEGFDIMPDGVDYCSAHVTPAYPRFRFQRADIFNAFYNPSGRQRAEHYVFPYPDASFDIVFSTSVFTHLPPPAVAQYLRETSRVLKPGGKCLHTCFALNEASLAAIHNGTANPPLNHAMDGFLTSDPVHVEAAIGIAQSQYHDMYAKAGLRIDHFFPGTWAGRTSPCLSYQDVFVATRQTT